MMLSVYSSIGSALLVFFSPLFGHASDVFGRKVSGGSTYCQFGANTNCYGQVFLVASQVLNLITTLAAIYFTLSGGAITLYFVLSLLGG